MRIWITSVLALSLLVGAADAAHVRVFSVQGVDCGSCGEPIKAAVKKIKGVKKVEFDIHRVELNVVASERVSDDAILQAIEGAEEGFHAVVGPGKGAYLPMEKYPEGADVALLTDNGSAVGALEKLRVPGKLTVFDFYADWCGPCRIVDAQLRGITGKRKDVAVRKLNVVRFESPLARELGAKLKALPYVVVFTPDGGRTDAIGPDAQKLLATLETE